MDSGIGALSFVPCLSAKLPSTPLIAFSDQEFFPYGDKEEILIVERLISKAEELVKLCAPTSILIACNTASTIVLPALRERFHIPIVGIVPGIKPAAQNSKSKKVALLATSATVSRQYTDDLIADFAKDCEVIKVGSSKLASIAEQKILQGFCSISEIKQELFTLDNEFEVDHLVLGCTHFTFIKDEIGESLNFKPTIIDPIEAVANQVVRVTNPKTNNAAVRYLMVSSREKRYSNLDLTAHGIDEIIYL